MLGEQETRRLIRDINRLRFCWWERKMRCNYYSVVKDVHEDKIEMLEEKVEQLEKIIARHQRDNCEAG